ncbi:hypothetical protein HZH66_002329 [Vespula vulgaris]|uniref:Uncharacterized protein n=1 Tax=Vespula vulgaris TaxID=7454 RepID=A0A834NFV3_VESVU|nr:hypothetical protein HZH66_002329 [Vespula vulgaris]
MSDDPKEGSVDGDGSGSGSGIGIASASASVSAIGNGSSGSSEWRSHDTGWKACFEDDVDDDEDDEDEDDDEGVEGRAFVNKPGALCEREYDIPVWGIVSTEFSRQR